MKKLIGFILIICLTFPPLAFAEVVSSASNSSSSFIYSIQDNSTFKSVESPMVTNLAPNANVPSLYRNQSEMKTSLDMDNNTKFLTSLMFKNKIKLNIVKAYSYSHFFNKAISTGEIAIDRSNDFIEFLPEIPVGDDVWPTAHRRNVKKEGDESFDRVICTALEEAYEKSDNSRYFTIKYEICDFSQVSNKGIGAGATFTKDIGGSTALSSGVTVGASSAKGNVFKGGYYEITFWNRGKSALVSSAPKAEEKESKKTDVGVIPEAAEIFFDFDSYVIKADQYQAIEKNVEIVEIILKKILPNEVICFVGSTCKIGKREYNQNLGDYRSEEVYVATMRRLHEKGYDLDVIGSKIQFCSKGKLFPESIENEKNRKVTLNILRKL